MKLFSIAKFSTGLTLALEIIADDSLQVTFINDRDANRIVLVGQVETISYIRRYVEANTIDF